VTALVAGATPRAGWPIGGSRRQPWGLRDFRLLDAGGCSVRLTGP